jgi:hypothetical protein
MHSIHDPCPFREPQRLPRHLWGRPLSPALNRFLDHPWTQRSLALIDHSLRIGTAMLAGGALVVILGVHYLPHILDRDCHYLAGADLDAVLAAHDVYRQERAPSPEELRARDMKLYPARAATARYVRAWRVCDVGTLALD